MLRIARLLSLCLALAVASVNAPVASAQVLTLTFTDLAEINGRDGAALAIRGGDVADAGRASPAFATFGPFRMVDSQTAEMHGVVDGTSPAQFAAMRAAFPHLQTLRMIECPGSDDDEANLELARMVRAARIVTVVPAGGSVRSGAVELFLAGVRRQADSRAEFAVHSWRDELGREASDLAEDDPVHREYLDFYREMGLSEDSARRFYALTNSVAFDDALYLEPLQLAAMGLLDVI